MCDHCNIEVFNEPNELIMLNRNIRIGISGPILLSTFYDYLNDIPQSISTVPIGLGGTAVNLIAKGLLERGYRLVIFSLDPSVNDEIIFRGPRLTICMGPYRSRAKLRAMDFFKKERDYIKKAAAREKPDIIHAHWTYEFALGALSSGIKTLVTVRDWAPKILWFNKHPYRLIRFFMDWKTFILSRNITANSFYIQRLISLRYLRKVPVIPNPIEDSLFRCNEKKRNAYEPIVVSVCNGMGKHKNIENLIVAFKTIKRNIPACRLRLIGEEFGPHQSAEKWSKTRELDKGIEFIGSVSRDVLINLLDEADLLIHPSLEESFGNTLIEAMARRVPVIGGNKSGAVPWVLDHGIAGILCDVKNPDDIAASAINLLQSDELWKKMSMAGYSRTIKQFNMDRVIGLCVNEYKKLLSERT